MVSLKPIVEIGLDPYFGFTDWVRTREGKRQERQRIPNFWRVLASP
jgi:hypothetical protein